MITKPYRTATSQGEWRQAQVQELNDWVRQQNALHILHRMVSKRSWRQDRVFDDWNEWWEGAFDRYASLPLNCGNVIEVGCGPYTNVRRILTNHAADWVVCSDPLAGHYAGFQHGWLSQGYRERALTLDNHMCESLPFRDALFDVLVMINVLDHVQDAFQGLGEAHRILKPGGLFVFGQDLTNEEDLQRGDDPKHPIRLHHTDLEGFLSERYESRLAKLLGRGESRAPSAHYATMVYVGAKRH